MATMKPRIQVTLDDHTNALLAVFAEQQAGSISSVAAELIKEALELYEDKALSDLAEKRWKNAKRWHNHEDVWK